MDNNTMPLGSLAIRLVPIPTPQVIVLMPFLACAQALYLYTESLISINYCKGHLTC